MVKHGWKTKLLVLDLNMSEALDISTASSLYPSLSRYVSFSFMKSSKPLARLEGPSLESVGFFFLGQGPESEIFMKYPPLIYLKFGIIYGFIFKMMYYIWGYMRDYISHYQKLAGTTSYQRIYKGLSNRATSLLIHLRYIFLRSNLTQIICITALQRTL